MNLLLKSLLEFVLYFFPVKKKTVLFCSFFGQYNDNPRYVSEKLHNIAPEYKIIWVHTSKGRDLFPNYIEHVEFNSVKFLYYLYTAQVLVDNHTGLRSGGCAEYKKLLRLYFKIRSIRKKGQFTISTWHGTPLKKIGLDEPGADKIRFYYNCDVLLSGCSYTTRCLETANRNLLKIYETGTPRNDILLDEGVDIIELKKKIGLPLNKKILLYAPTFRESIELSGLRQITQDFKIDELLTTLSKRFGGDWCFAYRVHNLVLQKIDLEVISKTGADADSMVNANIHDDMAEYLKCADILVTDYSASLFDILLTEKPCFLYTPDYDEYKNQERGFYLDFSCLPFSYAKTFEEFKEILNEFDRDEYESRREVFLKTIGNKEDGRASERVVKMITEFCTK